MFAIKPNWPAPSWVHALTTTRLHGCSDEEHASFNLAMHVDDNPEKVRLNRLRLRQSLNLKFEPVWLEQTYSSRLYEVRQPKNNLQQADGAYTKQVNLQCVVLTGDCLPLLLCDEQGSIVAAVHCGWRGMLNGIIENAIQAMQNHAKGNLLAWMGPAIGPQCFEVGEDVRQPFIKHNLRAMQAFQSTSKPGKWLADIYQLARIRLQSLGVNAIYGGDYCTFLDKEHFYSYRRDKTTGRMATLIWLNPV